MIRFMEAQKKVIVFDLLWAKISDTSAKTVLENSNGAESAVVLSNGSQSLAGYLGKQTAASLPAKKEYLSFAAMVAAHFDNEPALLLISERADDESIMVAVKNGLPVPDYDRYDRTEDVEEAAKAFLRDNPDARIVGSTSSDSEYFNDLQEFDIDEFLDSKVAKKYHRSATIKKLSSGRVRQVIILALVAGVGYMGWDYYDSEQKRLAEEAERANKPDPAVVYAQALPQAIAGEGMKPSDAKEIATTAFKVNLKRAGWKVIAINCGKASCSFKWSRERKSATYEELVGEIGKEGVSFNVQDNTAVQVTQNKVSIPSVNTSKLPSDWDMSVGFISDVQRLGNFVNCQFQPRAIFPAGGVTPPTAISKTQLSCGAKLWGMEIFDMLPDNALVKDVLIEPKGLDSKITISAVYFTR